MIGILSRKKNQAIDAFAKGLADELADRFPPQPEGGESDKKRDRKLGRALDEIYGRAGAFYADEGLGVYGKARLGNTFKWALLEMDYDTAFVEEVTRGLVLRMTGR